MLAVFSAPDAVVIAALLAAVGSSIATWVNSHRAAEDKWKAQHVIHLIWVISTTRCHHCVRTNFFYLLRQNLRSRIC